MKYLRWIPSDRNKCYHKSGAILKFRKNGLFSLWELLIPGLAYLGNGTIDKDDVWGAIAWADNELKRLGYQEEEMMGQSIVGIKFVAKEPISVGQVAVVDVDGRLRLYSPKPRILWTPDALNPYSPDHRAWHRGEGHYSLHLWFNQPMIGHVWQVVCLDGRVHVLESTSVFSVNQSDAALDWAEAAVQRHLAY